jgi:ribosome maturation factor RimP
MDKSKFIGFLNRYSLGGNTDSAKLVISDKTLSTKFISTDQNVIGDVTLNSFDLPDAELGIYQTAQLQKLLSAVDEQMEVNLNVVESKAYSINFKDKSTAVTYMLADLAVIRQVPNLKSLPPFEVKIELNKDFTNNFKKAVGALDSENFGVECNLGETKVIVNYSSVNTNRVVFNATTVEAEDMPVTCFSAKLLKEIINANSDATGTLEVSSKGLARVTFTNTEYSAVYYLVKLTVA